MEIVSLTTDYTSRLAFFGENNKEEFKYFTPHSFDEETINTNIKTAIKDLYFVAVFDDKIIAYGMLRGMDEGYEIPSLGIAVDKNYYNKGLGYLLMSFLETSARLHGYDKMRLRVNKNNQKAISLYRTLGYNFTVSDENNLLGIKNLNDRPTILRAI